MIADSCSGGLSVLKYIEKWSGNYKIVYLADYEMNPFGIKSKDEIVSIVRSWFTNTNLARLEDVSIVIIACNTASIAIKDERENLSKLYKVPIMSMIEGVAECYKNNEASIGNKNVAIMATKYTIKSGEYQKLIEKYHPNKIIRLIATKSEREVAWGTYNSVDGKINIADELSKYRSEKIDTVILACTCFKMIIDQIKDALRNNIVCLDPALEVSRLTKKILNIENGISGPEIIIFNSANKKETVKSLRTSCKINLGKVPKISHLNLNR